MCVCVGGGGGGGGGGGTKKKSSLVIFRVFLCAFLISPEQTVEIVNQQPLLNLS